MAVRQLGAAPSRAEDAVTKGYSDARYTNRYTFEPGSSGGTRRYVRLLTIDGLGGSNGGYANVLLSGTGDFGNPNRGTLLIHAAQRGDNGFTVKAWAWNTEATSDPIELYSVQISTYVFEVWARLSDWNQTHELHVLASYGTTFNISSAQTTAPAGAVAIPYTSYADEMAAKASKAYVDAAVAGAPGSGQPTYVGPTQPTVAAGQAYLWVQTGIGTSGGDWSFWIEDGVTSAA